MESPPLSEVSTPAEEHQPRNDWLDILTLSIVALGLLYLGLFWFIPFLTPDHAVTYWLLVEDKRTIIYALSITIPLFCAIISVPLVIRKAIQLPEIGCPLAIVFFLYSAALILTFLYIRIMSFNDNSRYHLDETYLNGSIYRLAYWPSGSDGTHYILFKCDNFGFICGNVHSIDVEKPSGLLELIAVSAQNTIEIRDGRALLNTYSPS
jgi:hypothetical protein